MTDDEWPAAVWLPQTGADPRARYVVRRPHSPVRVAIVGDRVDPFADPGELSDHAIEAAWPRLLDSVLAQGLEPRGDWILMIVPPDVDWHEMIGEEVTSLIEARLASDSDLKVLYVAEIVDSAGLEAWPLEMLS